MLLCCANGMFLFSFLAFLFVLGELSGRGGGGSVGGDFRFFGRSGNALLDEFNMGG